jgi:hypothetical protein
MCGVYMFLSSMDHILSDMLFSSVDHILPGMLLLSMESVFPGITVKCRPHLTRHVYYQVWTMSYHTLLSNMDYILLGMLLFSMDYVITDISLSIVDRVVPDMLLIAKYEPHILGINLIQKMRLGSNHQHHI